MTCLRNIVRKRWNLKEISFPLTTVYGYFPIFIDINQCIKQLEEADRGFPDSIINDVISVLIKMENNLKAIKDFCGLYDQYEFCKKSDLLYEALELATECRKFKNTQDFIKFVNFGLDFYEYCLTRLPDEIGSINGAEDICYRSDNWWHLIKRAKILQEDDIKWKQLNEKHEKIWETKQHWF